MICRECECAEPATGAIEIEPPACEACVRFDLLRSQAHCEWYRQQSTRDLAVALHNHGTALEAQIAMNRCDENKVLLKAQYLEHCREAHAEQMQGWGL